MTKECVLWWGGDGAAIKGERKSKCPIRNKKP